MRLNILTAVKDFLDEIPMGESSTIYAHLKSLEENRVEGLVLKTLKGKVKELIVKQYRVIFFYHQQRRICGGCI